jgi:hypothetical protein
MVKEERLTAARLEVGCRNERGRCFTRHTSCALPDASADREEASRVESADFLTAEQKRDIFCNNAARFLRLDEKGYPQ